VEYFTNIPGSQASIAEKNETLISGVFLAPTHDEPIYLSNSNIFVLFCFGERVEKRRIYI